MPSSRSLRVFLCHSSQDKPSVRKLYQRLLKYANLEPWLDEKKILPGQDWDLEIRKAIRASDVIIICLSNNSITKEGYVQKEIKLAIDIAQEKPEGVIFLIPLLLEDCHVPESFRDRHWVKYYEDIETNHSLLAKALRKRGETLGITLTEYAYSNPYDANQEPKELYHFIKIPQDVELPYTFWIAKYPVTNAQYERFVSAPDFTDDSFWTDFPMYDYDCKYLGMWTRKQDEESRPSDLENLTVNTSFASVFKTKPRYWDRKDLGRDRKFAPVVAVNWYSANAYCKWVLKHWSELDESRFLDVMPERIRLPHEKEWVKVAGGDKPKNRFPWDEKGRTTKNLNEIRRYANLGKGGYLSTTSVDKYLGGASPFGVMDMAGNMREWQSNLFYERFGRTDTKRFAVRGGWYKGGIKLACLSGREDISPYSGYIQVGLRIALFSSIDV